MRDAFIARLTQLAEADDRIVLVTGDLGFGVLNDFATRFPDRMINAGVAEQNMTAIAFGLAREGFKAYTYSIGNFPTLRCLEHVRNTVCYHGADVTIVAVGGGFSYGQLGMSHFATEDMAIMRTLPGMTVVAPTDPWEAAELTEQLYKRGQPAYLRIDKGNAGLPEEPVTLGKMRQVSEGSDVALFAAGGILSEAVAAADLLRDKGISASVHGVHTIKPFDTAAVATAAGKLVVSIEEHSVIGGLGSAIAETCLTDGVAVRGLLRVGLDDVFPTIVGDQTYLRDVHGMAAPAIADRVCAKLEAI